MSPHKVDLFTAVANLPEVGAVTQIAQESIPEARVALGWSLPIHTIPTVIAPEVSEIRRIVEGSSTEAVHIFSGIHWVPVIVAGLVEVLRIRRRFGVMSEPRSFEGLPGWARLAHSWVTERRVRNSVDFVLAIGRNGPRWFRRAGFREGTIFPFAYFLPSSGTCGYRPPDDRVRVGYLGRLTRPKGLHLFLEAIGMVRYPITVEIVGDGPDVPRIERVRWQSTFPIIFEGPMPMESVPKFLARTDILVVPSMTTDDGWGAVISEALLAGVAVVASDRVGGSVCLDADWRGRVFDVLTPKALAGTIDDLIGGNQLGQEFRKVRSEWAASRLTGTAGARYLLEILDHVYCGGVRPRPFYAEMR